MAWYRAGTIAVTNGSATVNGTGTSFVDNAKSGYALIGPDGRVYEIDTIVSATVITLAEVYLGSTASGQSYKIQPTQSFVADLANGVSDLITSFADVRDGIGQGLIDAGSSSAPGIRFAADQDTGIYLAGTNMLGAAVGGLSRMVLSATGVTFPRFLSTGVGVSTDEVQLDVGGARTGDGSACVDLHATSGADYEGRLYRASGANGDLGLYNKGNGSLSLVNEGSGAVVIQTSSTPRALFTGTAFQPAVDNAYSLGIGSYRFSVAYAATGTINTSDEREKHWRGAPTDAERRAAKRIIAELGFYLWNDAVAEKGEDGARLHFGVRAQAVVRILMEEGVEEDQDIDFPIDVFVADATRPSFRNAFACFDTWADEFEPEYHTIDNMQEIVVGYEPTGLLDSAGAALMRPVTKPINRAERVATGQMVKTRAAGNRFGVRVDQLTLFLLSALVDRIAALEA